jgi:hypothetical protein
MNSWPVHINISPRVLTSACHQVNLPRFSSTYLTHLRGSKDVALYLGAVEK